MLEYIVGFSWVKLILMSFLINFLLVMMSISMYMFIEKTCPKPRLQEKHHPIEKADILLTCSTISSNSLLMIIGFIFWKNRWLVLTEGNDWLPIFVQIIALVLIMDCLMYFFHRMAHYPLVYKWIHGKHHDHISVNHLSLFVLHPIEATGFGIMVLLILLCYPFSVYSVSIYFVINVLWGTIGHLNKEFFPASWEKFGVGTSRFHNRHHRSENKNFGFYTSIWDRLLKTYKAN